MTNDLAVVKKDVVDVVARKVQEFIKRGELRLPAGYSPDNAMKSAWLILQNTLNRDKKPVLQVCNKTSIANALLDMVVQGLNPMKKQGYFIAYGDQLVFQRSYFGTMALAKMIDDTIADIVAEVVYEGDTFKYAMVRGRKEISIHEQALENINSKKIKAAYCLIINTDGEIAKTEIMTFEEIKQSWKQSQVNPVDEKGQVKAGSTHDKFTAEMAKKTIINRACKTILNSSSDRHLLRQSIVRSGEIQAEIEVAEEIELNANSEAIDIVEAEFEDIPVGEPAPVTEPIKGKQQTLTADEPDF